jgi:hypothetical protein
MLYVDFNDHTFQFEDLTLISEMKNMIKQKEQSFDMTANDAQKQKLLFIVEMIFVLMISQGLAGFIGVFGIYDYYFSISSLLPYSFILYLSLVLFSILLIKLFLKSSSLIYDVLSTLTALILFFYPLVAITTIADINIYFDKSIAKSTEAKVLKKGQAYKNSRYINISLPERKDEVFKQSIPRSEWEKLSEGDQVIVWQKDGYLNIPYFSKLDTKK